MSGRRRASLAEDARLLGQSSYIYEAGACVVLDGEEHWLTGALLPGEETIAQQIERSGAPALLLEHYAGRLEHHDPWHTAREVSHLFRGLVDASEADRVLVEHGHEGLRLVDNGSVSRAALPRWRACRRCGLPPGAGGSLEGGGRRFPPPRAGVRARGDVRGRATRARTWRARRTCTPSGWWPTRWRGTRRSARRSPSTRTCACARRPTARGCTRPLSAC